MNGSVPGFDTVHRIKHRSLNDGRRPSQDKGVGAIHKGST
jgi:hypothetical protein